MSYATLESQIRLLPEECLEEVSNYDEFVLFCQANMEVNRNKGDLSEFFGSLKGLPDGLEYQRSIHDEWN